MGQILEGVKVIESGDGVAVRYCGRLFAILGADVLRVERQGDRTIGHAGHLGEAYGRWLDAGKQIGCDDLSGNAADLVIAGQAAQAISTAERLCEDADAVLLALTWFDPAGPYRDVQATDETIAALSGIAYCFGEAGGPPMLAQGHIPQVTAGLVGFIGALAQLLQPRARRARRIDVNIFETSLCFTETASLASRISGEATQRLGVNRYVPTYPCSAYRCADGWAGVTCLTPAQWHALCGLMGRADLATDDRFASALQRLHLAEEVDAVLSDAFLRRTQSEWIELGIRHRIPIAPMPHPGELPSVLHWAERDAFAAVEGEVGVQGPTLPFRAAFHPETARRWEPEGMAGPLSGLRVVDFGMGWAGPLCGRMLGDLGADVIKVESHAHPDWWRGWESGAVDTETRETQHNFINVNRNKRGISIDLTEESGRAQARALLTGADVVLENYAAGVLTKLGLGPDVQRALRPDVISVSMPAFGNGGPLSGIRAYGSTVEQASGLPFVNGLAHWVPAQSHIALGDPVSGLFAAAGILACLYGRGRVGGADLDMSQVACLFQLGADSIIAEQVTGMPLERTGFERARLAVCAVVRTLQKDRWLAVAVPAGADPGVLEQVTGGPGNEALSVWAGRIEAEEAAQRLRAAGIAAAPVVAPEDLLNDPQLTATGYFTSMTRAFVGEHLVGAVPFLIDGKRVPLRRPAPLLGEHTAEVLAEVNFS